MCRAAAAVAAAAAAAAVAYIFGRWYERREIEARRNVDRSARRPFCEVVYRHLYYVRYRHHYHIIVAIVADPLFMTAFQRPDQFESYMKP